MSGANNRGGHPLAVSKTRFLGLAPRCRVVAGEKLKLMTKNSLICSLGLAALTIVFTSSKKENEENVYFDEIQSLGRESLVSGGELPADSLKGKMLIVSFWASYDPMSRINSFDLLEINDRYSAASFDGGEGLSVVCVSLDTFRSPALKAIEADGTSDFLHICDLRGDDSPLARNFDVNRPVNLLVSADGRILARDFGTSVISDALKMLRR